jgi:phage-related protein
MIIPTLVLDPQFEITESTKFPIVENKLGDGYYQRSSKSFLPSKSWQVKAVGLTTAQIDSINQQLKTFQGFQGFFWRPNEDEVETIYECQAWDTALIAPNVWEFSAEFISDTSQSCDAYRAYINRNELLEWLDKAKNFTGTYSLSPDPFIFTPAGLSKDSFQTVNVTPTKLGSASNARTQALAIKAAVSAYAATGVDIWKGWAQNYANAAVNHFYSVSTVPADINTRWLPNEWVNVTGNNLTVGKTSTFYENNGHFGLVLNFVSGVAVIPYATYNGDRLANVYRVYPTSTNLTWNNLYSGTSSNEEYEIEYWISNIQMQNTFYKVYSNSDKTGGTIPTVTSDLVGTIKLKTAYNGAAKIAYSTYTTQSIAPLEKFDDYPAIRQLAAGQIKASFSSLTEFFDGFFILYTITYDPKWLRAAQTVVSNILTLVNIPNTSNYYKTNTSEYPNTTPGFQIVGGSNTVSKSSIPNKLNWLKVDTSSAIELQNVDQVTNFQSDTEILINFASAADTAVKVQLTSSTATYQADFYSPGFEVNVQRSFKASEFYNWAADNVIWYPTLSNNPFTTKITNDASISSKLEELTFSNNKTLIYSSTLRSGLRGIASLVYTQTGKNITNPPTFNFNVTGDPVIIRLIDNLDQIWDKVQPATNNWVSQKYIWSDFYYSFANSTVQGSKIPSTSGNIKSIEIVTSGVSTVKTRSITTDGLLETIAIPSLITKVSVSALRVVTNTFYLGDFRAVNNTAEQMEYSGGVLPKGVVFNGFPSNPVVDEYIGSYHVGYQNPAFFYKTNQPFYGSESLRFLRDAQDAYFSQSNYYETGFFAPAYNWNKWDGLLKGEPETFTWNSVEPNVENFSLQARAALGAAEAYKLDPSNNLARSITMRFLNAVDADYRRRNTIQPLTNVRRLFYPQALAHNPANAALILRIALYANLAGESEGVTFRLIKKSIDYLRMQYISAGSMVGSFAAFQTAFTVGSTVYNGYSCEWHMEIVLALSELLMNQTAIRVPSCNIPLW